MVHQYGEQIGFLSTSQRFDVTPKIKTFVQVLSSRIIVEVDRVLANETHFASRKRSNYNICQGCWKHFECFFFKIKKTMQYRVCYQNVHHKYTICYNRLCCKIYFVECMHYNSWSTVALTFFFLIRKYTISYDRFLTNQKRSWSWARCLTSQPVHN